MTEEEYYELLKQNSLKQTDKQQGLDEASDLITQLIEDGYLSYDAIIDGAYNKKMLIYEHIDPIEGKVIDMRAICLDRDNIHWGNIIDTKDGRNFMAVTRNDWNEAYNKYKIRQLDDMITYTVDGSVKSMPCTIADKGLYDEISYINEQNVFEDKDLRAAIIQYNNDTKKLNLFDDVSINNEQYRIVKIDNYTLKEYDEEFGVMQLVVVDTPFGKITKNNDTQDIKGVILPAKVKDKNLNSKSKEIYCYHNKIKRGDYIDFTYDRDKQGTLITEKYLAFNKPTMEVGYDKTLLYICENSVNLLNSKGEVVTTPLYFEDNRTRNDKETDGEYIRLRNSSYMAYMQDNEITSKIEQKVNRILVKGKAYRITGTDDVSNNGVISIGLEIDQITPDDNIELGVANYYSQMDEINGSNPTPQGEIKGDAELYLGYANEYILEMPNVCTWNVDNPNVLLTDLGGNKCELLCESTKELNKTVVLTATLSGVKFTKEIKIVSI